MVAKMVDHDTSEGWKALGATEHSTSKQGTWLTSLSTFVVQHIDTYASRGVSETS